MRFRTKSANEIAADALRMAERKESEGCSPCAEAYRKLAHDPSRRRMLRNALLGAGGLAAASLTDPAALLAASPERGTPLEPVDPSAARRLHGQVLAASREATQLSRLVGEGGEVRAYRATGGEVVTRSDGAAILVVIRAGSDLHAAAFEGDRALTVQNGVVVEDSALTAKYRETRTSVQQARQHPILLTLVGPQSAAAACPACGALIAACATATAACGGCVVLGFRDCNALCGVAAGTCLSAITCCNS